LEAVLLVGSTVGPYQILELRNSAGTIMLDALDPDFDITP
jgi:hypothetical protein